MTNENTKIEFNPGLIKEYKIVNCINFEKHQIDLTVNSLTWESEEKNYLNQFPTFLEHSGL